MEAISTLDGMSEAERREQAGAEQALQLLITSDAKKAQRIKGGKLADE